MNRGLRHYDIFTSDTDRQVFLDLCRRAADESDTRISAYCLMGNHFHIVIHCPDGGLSETLQRLSGRYTRAFNRANGFDGPLFRSRFHSEEILSDEQLLVTTRYVHRNPLELGLRIDDYPWSTYPGYLTGSPTWVDAAIPLELAGGTASYRRFVEEPIPADEFAMSDGVRSAPAPMIAASRSDNGLDAIDDLVERKGGSGPRPTVRRNIAILAALACGRFSSEEIADHHGLLTGLSLRVTASRARSHLEDCEPCHRLHAEVRQLALGLPQAA